jgi:hypothetical protein
MVESLEATVPTEAIGTAERVVAGLSWAGVSRIGEDFWMADFITVDSTVVIIHYTIDTMPVT